MPTSRRKSGARSSARFENGLTVIPLRVEDVAPVDSLAYYISPVHWLDALTPPLEKHLQSLAGKVKLILGSRIQAPGKVKSILGWRIQAPGVEPKEIERAKRLVDRTAIMLFFLGNLQMWLYLYGSIFGWSHLLERAGGVNQFSFDEWKELFLCHCGTAGGILAICAGVAMKRRRHYRLAIAGSIAVIMGSYVCSAASVLIGIWSIIVLLRPVVRSSFTS